MKKYAFILFFTIVIWTTSAAPQAELWPKWENSNAASSEVIDHSRWDRFLSRYLVTDSADGINRVRYAAVTVGDRRALSGYINGLEAVRVSNLNRKEQFAFWVNLYNAATVELVLEHYPVKSIRDIKPGSLFSSGPWDAKILSLEGETMSLNDIEHRILRPIWKDSRIHYIVNCASLGCPNLQPHALTSINSEQMLEQAASEYVNHSRGIRFDDNAGGTLVLSSIFDWYKTDFDGDIHGVIRHLQRYARGKFQNALDSFNGSVRYEYDWTLNGI